MTVVHQFLLERICFFFMIYYFGALVSDVGVSFSTNVE
jgi:hypothetical protein